MTHLNYSNENVDFNMCLIRKLLEIQYLYKKNLANSQQLARF